MGLHNVGVYSSPNIVSDEAALVTRNTRAGNERCMKSFGRKTLREEATWGTNAL
jgi:hypothetical protein